jgi:predicted RNA-binding protein YlxR (DUF448 family)
MVIFFVGCDRPIKVRLDTIIEFKEDIEEEYKNLDVESYVVARGLYIKINSSTLLDDKSRDLIVKETQDFISNKDLIKNLEKEFSFDKIIIWIEDDQDNYRYTKIEDGEWYPDFFKND